MFHSNETSSLSIDLQLVLAVLCKLGYYCRHAFNSMPPSNQLQLLHHTETQLYHIHVYVIKSVISHTCQKVTVIAHICHTDTVMSQKCHKDNSVFSIINGDYKFCAFLVNIFSFSFLLILTDTKCTCIFCKNKNIANKYAANTHPNDELL